MDQTQINEKLAKLAALEAKDLKAKEYNKKYYQSWKEKDDAVRAFYAKWFGKKVGNVELR